MAVDGGVIAGDACALPFADGSFDVIVASEIFEHVVDDEAAMLECARVLRARRRPRAERAADLPRGGQLAPQQGLPQQPRRSRPDLPPT